MKLFLAHAHSLNPFDLKAALLAGHAQHPVIIHFPIGLFIASVVFDLLAVWRKKPILAAVAYYNLLGAALTLPLAIATGLGAWQWQLEGATLKGNLRLHMICAVTSALLIFFLCWMRSRLRAKNISLGVSYVTVTLFALMAITLTGHLGGIVSGVEMP
ncbi:MAG: hypothetical protein DME98_06170 [Verrucomicrobia bacterium]|nr:MAG: hypothetical protein DME98_06170 [Verrucomicrobiota bacterium]PYJ35294.1 MAG: hypothetical protein DME88_02375 [Verrucomicrobiota bacterium]